MNVLFSGTLIGTLEDCEWPLIVGATGDAEYVNPFDQEQTTPGEWKRTS